MTGMRLLKECMRRREFTVSFMYEDIRNDPVKDSILPVQKMQASVLLFSGGMDSMWPAEESCEKIMKILEETDYPYPHHHIHYAHGSHYLLPISLKTDPVFYAERKYKEECRTIKADILEKTMQFLKEEW